MLTLRLIIHCNIMIHLIISELILSKSVISYLIHLIINLWISSCLIKLMPLLSIRIELIHIISPTIRISTSKKVKYPSMFYNSMACSRSINNFIIKNYFIFINSLILIWHRIRYLWIKILLSPISHILTILSFFALLIVNIFFRDNSFPFMITKILIKLFVIEVWVRVNKWIVIHIIWINII